jgi:protein-S-isoprenylcysteine O-methyltransferase Ste14
MHKIFSSVFLFVFLFLRSVKSMAQDSLRKEVPQMADGMRSNGKIYVVVTVLLIILAGLIFYVIQLDRRITRVENKGNRTSK